MKTIAVMLMLAVAPAQAGWDEIKKSASDLGKAVSDSSKEVWDQVSDFSKETWESVAKWGDDALNTAGEWTDKSAEKGKEWLAVADKKLNEMLEPETPAEARMALDTMADTALIRLFNDQPSAKLLFDQAYGYAVFDSRKFSLLLHTNQGAGVAVNRQTSKHTYMKMFGAGLAAGFGGKFYQQVILFEDKAAFDGFVTQGWEATSEVGVVAGTESAELSAKYNGGMAIYQLDEKGLLLDMNISGSKYWVDEELTH
ncbi:lipoprotein [Photobacterium aquae]|uniref:Lipoprotein n=1 Tax=Photobacterium aquae TaxID=1195763 RepID=A0A0J1JXF2_9GAMM|nr:lipoprotein [Photobacterium aquae]KLV06972.1 lipoprotein [Photobacterium aquae]